MATVTDNHEQIVSPRSIRRCGGRADADGLWDFLLRGRRRSLAVVVLAIADEGTADDEMHFHLERPGTAPNRFGGRWLTG